MAGKLRHRTTARLAVQLDGIVLGHELPGLLVFALVVENSSDVAVVADIVLSAVDQREKDSEERTWRFVRAGVCSMVLGIRGLLSMLMSRCLGCFAASLGSGDAEGDDRFELVWGSCSKSPLLDCYALVHNTKNVRVGLELWTPSNLELLAQGWIDCNSDLLRTNCVYDHSSAALGSHRYAAVQSRQRSVLGASGVHGESQSGLGW